MTSDEETPVALADDQGIEETPVTAHQCSPDRIVFTEQDNTDGWISTDLTVDVTQ